MRKWYWILGHIRSLISWIRDQKQVFMMYISNYNPQWIENVIQVVITYWHIQRRDIAIPLTNWGRDKMDTIPQMTFSKAFSWIESSEIWFKFPRVQLTINQHGLRKWLGVECVTGHYLNRWWPRLLTRIPVTWPNKLGPIGHPFYWEYVLPDSSSQELVSPRISHFSSSYIA